MSPAIHGQLTTVRLNELVEFALRGRIRIPAYQRTFRWPAEAVVDLLESVRNGFPIGTIVVSQKPAPAGFAVIGPLQIEVPEVDDAWWIVDGQQRIASLVGSLTASSETTDARFRVFLDLQTGSFVWAKHRSAVPAHWLPVSVAASLTDLMRWESTRSLDARQVALAQEVTTALREYEIPVQVIAGDSTFVTEAFTRLNTHGTSLAPAEIENARQATTAEQPDLSRLAAVARGLGFGEFDQGLVKSLSHIDAGLDPTTFRDISTALTTAVDFLRDDVEIPHLKLLPNARLVLPLLVEFVRRFGRPDAEVAELLCRWTWRLATARTLPGWLQPETLVRLVESAASAREVVRDLAFDAQPGLPDLGATDLDTRGGQVNVLALLAANPRTLVAADNGDLPGPVNVIGLLEASQPPLLRIAPGGSVSNRLTGTIANRIVHPPAPHQAILGAFRDDSPPDVLASHLLDSRDVGLIRAGNWDEFLGRRSRRLNAMITLFVEQRARWSFRDRPVRPLFDDGTLTDVG